MSDIAVSVIGFCVSTVVVVLAVAFSHQQMTATLSAIWKQLQVAISVTNRDNPQGGGSLPPLSYLPVFGQQAGLLPDGSPDPQRYNDCGETCCAMVIAAVRGVELEPGWIREQIGGPSRSGLTTAADLEKALSLSHVQAAVSMPSGSDVLATLDEAWGNALPVIALGNWLEPGVLHWMLLAGKNAVGYVWNDPWAGARTTRTAAQVVSQYAGQLVLVQEHCQYNCSGMPTPGT